VKLQVDIMFIDEIIE